MSASSLEVYDDEEFEYYDISHKPSTSSDEQLSKASNESDRDIPVEEDDEKSLEIEDTSGHSDVEQLDANEGEPRVSAEGENEGVDQIPRRGGGDMTRDDEETDTATESSVPEAEAEGEYELSDLEDLMNASAISSFLESDESNASNASAISSFLNESDNSLGSFGSPMSEHEDGEDGKTAPQGDDGPLNGNPINNDDIVNEVVETVGDEPPSGAQDMLTDLNKTPVSHPSTSKNNNMSNNNNSNNNNINNNINNNNINNNNINNNNNNPNRLSLPELLRCANAVPNMTHDTTGTATVLTSDNAREVFSPDNNKGKVFLTFQKTDQGIQYIVTPSKTCNETATTTPNAATTKTPNAATTETPKEIPTPNRTLETNNDQSITTTMKTTGIEKTAATSLESEEAKCKNILRDQGIIAEKEPDASDSTKTHLNNDASADLLFPVVSNPRSLHLSPLKTGLENIVGGPKVSSPDTASPTFPPLPSSSDRVRLEPKKLKEDVNIRESLVALPSVLETLPVVNNKEVKTIDAQHERSVESHVTLSEILQNNLPETIPEILRDIPGVLDGKLLSEAIPESTPTSPKNFADMFEGISETLSSSASTGTKMTEKTPASPISSSQMDESVTATYESSLTDCKTVEPTLDVSKLLIDNKPIVHDQPSEVKGTSAEDEPSTDKKTPVESEPVVDDDREPTGNKHSKTSKPAPPQSTEAMKENFEIGDLIAGKMEGFGWWYGRVVEGECAPQEGYHWIYWFGDHKTLQLPTYALCGYWVFHLTFNKAKLKQAKYKRAVQVGRPK